MFFTSVINLSLNMKKINKVVKYFKTYKSLWINPNHIFGVIKIGYIPREANAYHFRQIQGQQKQF